MIKFAGGRDVFGEPSRPSFRVTLDDVVAAQPDVLIAAPCGYTAAQAREEYRSIDFPAWLARHPCRSKRACLRARCQQLFLSPRSSSCHRPRNSRQVAASCHRSEQGSGSRDRADRRCKTRHVGVAPTLCAAATLTLRTANSNFNHTCTKGQLTPSSQYIRVLHIRERLMIGTGH